MIHRFGMGCLGTMLFCNTLAGEDLAGLPEPGIELQVAAERQYPDTQGRILDSGSRQQGIELTASLEYTITRRLEFLAEIKGILERQNEDAEQDARTVRSWRRGELWLRWHPDPANSLFLQLGRQEFTEERQWWWDEDLDALRLEYSPAPWEFTLAFARETTRLSTLEDAVAPADSDVLRALGHAGRKFGSDYQLKVFALYQDDRSPTPAIGETVGDEDEIDADLFWLGLRMSAQLDTTLGPVAWWADSALVWGNEWFMEFSKNDNGITQIDGRQRRNVRGWALDLEASWSLPLPGAPRLLTGYALGSGDGDIQDTDERAFRQTGLQGNERQFHLYGDFFDPELSNLQVLTLGWSWPVTNNGAVALLFHDYRQVKAAPVLNDSGIDQEPLGSDKALGTEWDLAFRMETKFGLSVDASASVFTAGSAFGDADNERAWRTYLELTYEF